MTAKKEHGGETKININSDLINKRLIELGWNRTRFAEGVQSTPTTLISTLNQGKATLRILTKLINGLGLTYEQITSK